MIRCMSKKSIKPSRDLKEIFEMDIALKEYLLIGMDGGMNGWVEGGREEGREGLVNLDIAFKLVHIAANAT